jgi:Fur family ferric uptake transcriptional regulator
MTEIMDDWLGPLEERLENEYRFTVLDHRLDFQGICAKCQADKATEPDSE